MKHWHPYDILSLVSFSIRLQSYTLFMNWSRKKRIFPIGNDVALDDSSSLPLKTLRRCPSRLNDEESSEVVCDWQFAKARKHCVGKPLQALFCVFIVNLERKRSNFVH